MSHQQGVAHAVDQPPSLKVKFGAVGTIDPELIARAEAAIARMSRFFGPWLGEEIEHLAAARADIRNLGYIQQTADALNIRAHELKSMGAIFGFPIITDIARSFCRMTEEPSVRMFAPLPLIDLHLDAIGAAARDNVRDSDHPIGRALVDALNERVTAFLDGAPTAAR